MYRNILLDSSTDSDVFYVERSSTESSPIGNNTPAILNSTQLSEGMQREAITISSVACSEPQIVTTDSDFNEPTFPYAFGNQPNCAAQPRGPQLATQPLQYFGYYGRLSARSRRQPPINGAV